MNDALAFIFGVLPLTVAVGARTEIRQSLGSIVFAHMITVTVFGLLSTPTFTFRALLSHTGGA
jgi:multidrug efflux pump